MNAALLLLIAAQSLRPFPSMSEAVRPYASMSATAGGDVGAPASVTIDAMPYTRTVTCTGSYTLTGTATGGGAVTWAASPSGDSGACTGTGTWSCDAAVAPNVAGEGLETITISQSGGGSDTVDIGYYVAGSHSCFLAQSINGLYNVGMADLDAVATWENIGSSALDVTQAVGTAQPKLRTGIVGGQPVVRCDGGDDLSAAAAAAWAFLHDGTGMTVDAIVLQTTSSLGPIAGTSNGAPTQRGIGWRFSTTQRTNLYVSDGTSNVIDVSSANNAVVANLFHSMLVTFSTADTPDHTQYADGVSVGSGNASAVSALAPGNPLRFCVRPDAASTFLTGDLFRIIIYQSALDATQRGINLAVDEWALSSTLPVTP